MHLARKFTSTARNELMCITFSFYLISSHLQISQSTTTHHQTHTQGTCSCVNPSSWHTQSPSFPPQQLHLTCLNSSSRYTPKRKSNRLSLSLWQLQRNISRYSREIRKISCCSFSFLSIRSSVTTLHWFSLNPQHQNQACRLSKAVIPLELFVVTTLARFSLSQFLTSSKKSPVFPFTFSLPAHPNEKKKPKGNLIFYSKVHVKGLGLWIRLYFKTLNQIKFCSRKIKI